MTKKEVKIDITGVTGTGKTFIAILIEEALRDAGILAAFNDKDLSSSELLQIIDHKEEIKKTLSEKIAVSIETHQAKKLDLDLVDDFKKVLYENDHYKVPHNERISVESEKQSEKPSCETCGYYNEVVKSCDMTCHNWSSYKKES